MATLLFVFLATNWSNAGVHNPAEPPLELEKDLNLFLSQQLGGLRGLGPPDPLTGSISSKGRLDYLAKVEVLRAKRLSGRLTADEFASLGAYLIRLRGVEAGGLEEAVELLEAGRREHPRDFRILANLGTAFQQTGRLDAAERCLLGAEALAPAEHRQLTRYHLRLVRLRLRETAQPGLAPLDDLFADARGNTVRFVGEGGRWEVGKLSPAELTKLPNGSLDEAIVIVQRLLVCLPDDARLHWLLGELANAKGDLRAAARAMNVAVYDFRLSTRELRERRIILNDAAAWVSWFERLGNRAKQEAWLLDALGTALQPLTPTPDVAQLALGHERLSNRVAAGTVGSLEEPPPDTTALAVWESLGWKAWAIAAAGAGLVLALLLLQLRLALRRRRANCT
jgi:tetratricopeptide (TPR) repeat protein